MDCPPDLPLIGYRMGDGRHSLFDGTGAALYGARWNSPGRSVIFAATTYAGAMLEILARAGIGQVPRHTRWIEINIPEGISRECLDPDSLPGWDKDDCIASRSFGDTWLEQGRTAVLVVPSIVTRREQNLLINPAHPDFCRMLASRPLPVEWDRRLFARAD